MKKVITRVVTLSVCLFIIASTLIVRPVRTYASPTVLLPVVEEATATLLTALGMHFATEADAKNASYGAWNYMNDVEKYKDAALEWKTAVNNAHDGKIDVSDSVMNGIKSYIKSLSNGVTAGVVSVTDTVTIYTGAYSDPNKIDNYNISQASLNYFPSLDPSKSNKIIFETDGILHLQLFVWRQADIWDVNNNYQVKLGVGVRGYYDYIFKSTASMSLSFNLVDGKWAYQGHSSGGVANESDLKVKKDNISDETLIKKTDVKWTDTDIIDVATGEIVIPATDKKDISYTAHIDDIVQQDNYDSDYDYKDSDTGDRYVPQINNITNILNKTYNNVQNTTKVINSCNYKTSWRGKFSQCGTGNIPYTLTGRFFPSITYTGDVADVIGSWNVTWKYNDSKSTWDCTGTMVTTQATVTDVPTTFTFTGTTSKDFAATQAAVQEGVRTAADSGEKSEPSRDLPKMKVPADTLKNKFPFSIPWDIKNSITALVVPSSAPKWTINFPKAYFVGGGAIVINFQQFELWAKIIRWGVLIGFNIALILITRRVIGAS